VIQNRRASLVNFTGCLSEAIYRAGEKLDLKIVQRLLAIDDESVKVQELNQRWEGNFPIHFAIEHRCSADVILAIMKAWPEVLQTPNGHGNLPLHHALTFPSKHTETVVQIFLRNFPESVKMEVAEPPYKIPLELAQQREEELGPKVKGCGEERREDGAGTEGIGMWREEERGGSWDRRYKDMERGGERRELGPKV
jgi:hypothetical protein